MPAAIVLAASIALTQALLPACARQVTGPSKLWGSKIVDSTDCTGVAASTDPCDTSTSMPPVPDLPDLPCPTRAEVDIIRSEIPIKVNGDVSAGVLACRGRDGSVDLSVVENQVYQSLLFLRRVRFDRPLPWTILPVYDWVRATIPLGIVIESSGGYARSCLNCAGPIYLPFSSYEWLRPRFDLLLHTLIVHEARHAAGWPHTCGRDESYYGAFVRDMSVAEMGGFGVHYLLAYWIGHYSEEAAPVRDYSSQHAARLLGGGSFCCECGRGSRAASLMTRFFALPWQMTPTCRLAASIGS